MRIKPIVLTPEERKKTQRTFIITVVTGILAIIVYYLYKWGIIKVVG